MRKFALGIRVYVTMSSLPKADQATDRYDVFAINLASVMLGYVYGESECFIMPFNFILWTDPYNFLQTKS
jgi:hypothetical protein